MKLIKLILNADDFGLHESINTAIEIAHRNGVLTSTSLVVNGEAFEHAVAIAKRNRNLGVGLHLTLCGERPISPVKEIYSIVNSDGKLFENHGDLCKKILKQKVDLNHIAIECRSQIEKFLQSGLPITHIDSHRHLHLYPPIFKVLREVLKIYKINKIRWLNIPLFDYYKVGFKEIGFLLFLQYTKFLKSADFKHPDWFIGFFKSGKIDQDYIKGVLSKLRYGVTEINFHPGLSNVHIKNKYGFWQEYHEWECNWEKEYAVLLDTEIKEMIKSNNIELINYSFIK